MTTAQVVETSVTVNDNSPIQDYVNPDDQTQPTFEMTPGFKPFTMYDYIMKDRDEFNWLLVPYTGELTENVKDEDLPPNVIRLD